MGTGEVLRARGAGWDRARCRRQASSTSSGREGSLRCFANHDAGGSSPCRPADLGSPGDHSSGGSATDRRSYAWRTWHQGHFLYLHRPIVWRDDEGSPGGHASRPSRADRKSPQPGGDVGTLVLKSQQPAAGRATSMLGRLARCSQPAIDASRRARVGRGPEGGLVPPLCWLGSSRGRLRVRGRAAQRRAALTTTGESGRAASLDERACAPRAAPAALDEWLRS